MSFIEEELNQLDTPFFFLDRARMKHEVEQMRLAFQSYWNNYKIAYSVKTNSLPALATEFLNLGIDAEVVSYDEYQLIRALGFSRDRIVCNGPIKEPIWLDEIAYGSEVVNIDSQQEISYYLEAARLHPNRTFSVGIRVNLNLEQEFQEEINTNNLGSRFGFSYERGELKRAIERLQTLPNLKIVGLHFHVNSNTRSLAIYRYLIEHFVKLVKSYQLQEIRYVDMGGGYYGGVPGKPGWKDYLSTFAEVLTAGGFTPENLQLIIEPGVSLLASSLRYYTRVRDIRENAFSPIAILDGSRIHIDPFFQKQKHQYFYTQVKGDSSKRFSAVQLTGFTCLERDRFFTEEGEVGVGDLFIFDKVGAYTLTLSPLFISYFPPVYAVFEEKGIYKVRGKWTHHEFLQKSTK